MISQGLTQKVASVQAQGREVQKENERVSSWKLSQEQMLSPSQKHEKLTFLNISG
jgi:hypothetical protein